MKDLPPEVQASLEKKYKGLEAEQEKLFKILGEIWDEMEKIEGMLQNKRKELESEEEPELCGVIAY